MSHITYDKVWREAQLLADEATRHDLILQSADKPDTEKAQVRPIVVELYIHYVIVINKLIDCYDQMVQPQKLILIKKLLEATMGRIVELKQDLVNIDQRDIHHLNDEILLKMGVTPLDIELKVPSYFTTFRTGWQANWRDELDDILRKNGYYFEPEDKEEPMTEIEAIRLIQTHERARQGRIRAKLMREIKSLKKKGKQELDDPTGFGSMMAAIRIQKIWRGYVERRFTKKQKLAEMLLIGMLPPEETETTARDKQKEICGKRRMLREEYRIKYEQALIDTAEELKKTKTDVMIQDMKDEIRNWLHDYYSHSGKLPEFPSDERGGSRLMFSRMGLSSHGTDSEISKSTNVSSKESKGKKEKGDSKKSKDSADSKKKEVEESEINEEDQKYFRPVTSSFLSEIVAECDEFEEVWKNKNESGNPRQEHYQDMIIADKTSELETELRRVVDGMMRDELQLLQAALERDRAGRGKKQKKSSKKVRRGGKKSKKRKEKDLTPDRTLESLFEELVCNGIIRQYPKYKLEDFVGEKSFAPNEWGSLGDLRQLLIEYCILPLGSDFVHQNTQLMRSILITGVEGSGKKQLAYTICTETDAILFDISSTNIVGKYPGKSGLIMLMHLVSKVSRLLQPSVIYIDGAEKTFMRKVPKTDKSDPKRLKKDLPKLIKTITNEDRVMLIGVSSKPWDCDQKLLQQTYQHNIYIPKPIHSDLVLIWKHLFSPYKALRGFDAGPIARLSNGFAVGSIIKAMKEVMTCKRMVQLRSHPLQTIELAEALSKQQPIWKEHELALRQWFRK